MGEDQFIHKIFAQFPAPKHIVGIGDDCAVIPKDKKTVWLVTTDALVEGIHFIRDQITPQELGYKTVAVNISDISAMGGTPQYGFLSLALPQNLSVKWTRKFLQGFKQAASKWGIHLLGGDTVKSNRDIFINLTLVGSGKSKNIKFRHTAKVGDVICTTGFLGHSGAGLKILKHRLPQTKENKSCVHAHFNPVPNPKEGEWLGSQHAVHAMMDISDGLHKDLSRLIQSSNCGAVLNIERLPISHALKKVCDNQGWDPVELALTGGEDYCLLVTVDKKRFPVIQKAFHKKFRHDFFEIGVVTKSPSKVVFHRIGKKVHLSLTDFEQWD
jgi:thiamine-monophosphate kinase